MAYLLDSNVFIQAKNLHYGFDFCPAFWAWIDAQQEDGNVYSIEKVRDELIGGDDELAEWAKARGDDFFLPPDNDTLPSLATIASWAGSGHYEASAASQFLQVADYYLVAHAHAQGFDVVTHEVNSNSIRKIKNPDACIAHNVTAVNPFQMLRREKARFVLSERR